jgi:hypothetical protein
MNKPRAIEPIRKQRTIFYNSPRNTADSIGFYMHMFPEDMSVSIMPIGGRTKRPDFKITISPINMQVQEVIAAGLDERQGYHSLTEAVCKLFRTVAVNLSLSERAIFEIVYLEEPETKKNVGFELSLVNGSQLIRRGGQIFQRVPPTIANERNVPEMIPVPEEDIIEFRPPKDFEEALRSTRTNLTHLDQMRFSQLAVIAAEQKIPYNFKEHERSMKLALVEAVRPIGWYARGSYNNFVTSYYWIRLMIKFEKFKIELRHVMLTTLNEALKRIGLKLGFEAQIEITGLPKRVDVTDALRKLDLGEVPFTEVMKAFDLR